MDKRNLAPIINAMLKDEEFLCGGNYVYDNNGNSLDYDIDEDRIIEFIKENKFKEIKPCK